MKHLAHRFMMSGGGVALTLAVATARPMQAATIQPFFIDITDGKLAGEIYSGSFNYDETLLSGAGLETLSVADDLSLNFDFLGTPYTEANDLGFSTGRLPEVAFVDGVFSGLNYLVETGSLFFSIDEGTGQGLSGTSFTYEIGVANAPTDAGTGILRTDDSGAAVPEPTTLLGLLIMGGLGWAFKKQTDSTYHHKQG